MMGRIFTSMNSRCHSSITSRGRPAIGRQLEVEVVVDVERALLVVVVEPVVLALVLLALEDAALDEVLRPAVVAVAVEQGVVEVEERELHVSSGCSAAFRSGTVIGRPVSSEYRSSASSAWMSEGMSRRAWVRR